MDKTVNNLVITCGGLGYSVWTTEESQKKIALNSAIILWTHHAIREDSQDLYGFLSKEELAFFELLITVSGIGPKTALALLNTATGETIRKGVLSGDPAYLSKISGIGKKSAEKIVFELSGKIAAIEGEEFGGQTEDDDTADALKALGYHEKDVREVLKKIGMEGTAQHRIKKALSVLGKNK